METSPVQPELGEVVLSAEQQAEVNRLQHGVAVLDLFSQETEAEDRRKDFLQRTHPGSESRQAILAGPSYKGNEAKLERAISKAYNRYDIKHIRRRAMLEHAAFLGIPAILKGKEIIIESPVESRRLQLEHGKWIKSFASRYRTNERESYRGFLEGKIKAITGENTPESDEAVQDKNGVPTVVLGPHVNLEERAVRLTRAINTMARRSMLSGFGIATADEVYNQPVYDRYEDGTPHIDQAAINKRERLHVASKGDFWVASGFPSIRKSGIMKEYLLRRRSKKMWEEFEGQFEHSPQQKQRVKVRKQLSNYIPELRLAETKIK